MKRTYLKSGKGWEVVGSGYAFQPIPANLRLRRPRPTLVVLWVLMAMCWAGLVLTTMAYLIGWLA